MITSTLLRSEESAGEPVQGISARHLHRFLYRADILLRGLRGYVFHLDKDGANKMSMTKKEQAEVERLKTRLALRFTEDVKPDISVPSTGIVNGWGFNSYSRKVEKSCSTTVFHSDRQWNKTDSQQPIEQYSMPILAYKAMRRELEERFARELREIDRSIELLDGEVHKLDE